MKKLLIFLIASIAVSAKAEEKKVQFAKDSPFNPRTYVVYRAAEPIAIDGNLEKEVWQNAPWTEDFADIRGVDFEPKPIYRTRAKMLWDDEYLYIAAELEEPHLWGTITERDATMYWDNDFEVFIDPDNDTHNYTEFEMNALNAVWDLFFFRPYYKGGPYKVEWDIEGLKTAVKLYGTINDPSDTDSKWTVELAFPLKEISDTTIYGRKLEGGKQWRINFSRVEWLKTAVQDGKYVKLKDGFGNEENWVWSPIGTVNMHLPEQWGFIQFSDIPVGKGTEEFVWNPDEDIKWGLRVLLHRQSAFHGANKRFANKIEELQPETIDVRGVNFNPVLYPDPDGKKYKISAYGIDGSTLWSIDEEGKLRKEIR